MEKGQENVELSRRTSSATFTESPALMTIIYILSMTDRKRIPTPSFVVYKRLCAYFVGVIVGIM